LKKVLQDRYSNQDSKSTWRRSQVLLRKNVRTASSTKFVTPEKISQTKRGLHNNISSTNPESFIDKFFLKDCPKLGHEEMSNPHCPLKIQKMGF
jgi:hypothetical protein